MRTEQTAVPKLISTSDASFFDREVRWLRMDARNSRWIARGFLCALVIYLASIAILATGPINIFHNDVLMLLDDGWRVLNGQIPHRDFYSPLGPLEYWIVAGGMLLAKCGPQGIAIGIAAFGFSVGIWGWFLSRQRMPALFSLLVTAWIVLTATSPTPLGFDPRFLSCAMIYNRQGYALLGIILVECAIVHEEDRFWGGLSSGAALIMLGFLKLNFFGVAGLLLLTTVPLTRAEIARAWGFLTGAAGSMLAFLLYPRFSLSAFLSDMFYVTRSRGPSITLAGTINGIVTCAKAGTVWLVVAMTVVAVLSIAPGRRWRRQTVTLILLSFIVLASGLLFLQTNSLENRCQLASLWLIILLEKVSLFHLRTNHKTATVILIALSLGGIGGALVPDVVSFFNLLRFYSPAERPLGTGIAVAGTESLRFSDSSSFYDTSTKANDGNGSYYLTCLNDGLELLIRQSRPDESILSLGFHNPFSYLLRRRPAEGGSSYLYMGNSISENHMPGVNRVFGDADLIVLPDHEGTHRTSDLYIQSYYQSYLLQNFRFVARSRYWSLYRRNR